MRGPESTLFCRWSGKALMKQRERVSHENHIDVLRKNIADREQEIQKEP